MIPGKLIALALVVVAFIVALYGFTTHGSLVHIGLVATPFLILMLNNPGLWFVMVLGLDRSGLIFPGLPQGLQVVHVMMAGFVGLMLARSIIVKPSREKWAVSDYFLFAFVGVLLVTIAARGIGIRALGSNLWGGMSYVKLLIAAGFLITARQVTLTPRQLKQAVLLMLALSFLPALAQLLFVLSGGAIYQQYRFVEAIVPALLTTLSAYESGAGTVRFQLLGGVATSLFVMGLILIEFRGAKRVLLLLLLGAAGIMAALSGFRGTIVGLGASLVFYVLLVSPGRRKVRIIQFVLLGILGVGMLFPFVRYLPDSIQRAVSFIPFFDIAPDVMLDADGSRLWRVEIWKLAWAEVPRYLWIGKGFTFAPATTMSISVRMNSVLNAFLSHNYHSGPLTLLLDMGVFGFIAGAGFLITSAHELLRKTKVAIDNPFLYRCYMVLLARYLYSVLAYFFIFGDARESFVTAFMAVAFLQAIHRTAVREAGDPKAENRMARSRATPSQRTPAFSHPVIRPF